jgi:hypothetical protein
MSGTCGLAAPPSTDFRHTHRALRGRPADCIWWKVMVTKVKCVNLACQHYGVKKSVVNAGVMVMDYRKCAACGGKMVTAERTKPT